MTAVLRSSGSGRQPAQVYAHCIRDILAGAGRSGEPAAGQDHEQLARRTGFGGAGEVTQHAVSRLVAALQCLPVGPMSARIGLALQYELVGKLHEGIVAKLTTYDAGLRKKNDAFVRLDSLMIAKHLPRRLSRPATKIIGRKYQAAAV